MATNWVQVNKDGFGYPPSSSAQGGTGLFTFGGHLFAHNKNGLFQMDSLVCRAWEKVFTPAEYFGLLVDYLYCYGPNELWWIKQGEEFSSVNWKQVTLKGLPAGIIPSRLTVFSGEIYGFYEYHDSNSGASTFDICRSKDIGKTVMNWQPVVTNGFDDPQNRTLDFMGEFNKKICAGTNTRKAMFGNSGNYGGGGVEIWESSSGDPGTWTQVNADGFGTEIALNNKMVRTNHVIGSWAVYKAPSQPQEYLYVGTKSALGAEVWRYDGKGKNGWKNVTPPWAGPPAGPIGYAGAGRNEGMVVFQDEPYLAEEYPTGNLAKYDGTNWSIVVNGPNPFDPQNGGLTSLDVFENHLYVHTSHLPYSGATKGDQVWGSPFNFIVWRFACSIKSILGWWRRSIRP